VLVGAQRLGRGAGAAIAAADQADPQCVAAGRVDGLVQGKDAANQGGRRGLEEVAAAGGWCGGRHGDSLGEVSGPSPEREGGHAVSLAHASGSDGVAHFFSGCSSNLRKYISNPSDCSRILPAAGYTS